MGQVDHKIKILYVVGTFRIGGAEKHIVQLLKGIDREKFEPAVCCIQKQGAYLPIVEGLGIPILDLGLRKYYSLKAVRRFFFLVRHIRKNKYDIVHTFLFLANVYGALAAYLARGPKIVISIRSMNLFFKARHIWTSRFIGRLADRITVVSEQVRHHVLKREKLNPRKISVIHNGVDPDSLRGAPDREEKRKEIGIEKADPVLSCVANLHEKKGHRYLITALPGLIEEFPSLCLLLIGEGEYRAAIERQVNALNLNGHVKFLGRRRDVPELLDITDLFVLPSLEEGMSNALLEAMAMGKPTIVTDVGGNPDVVVDGETGLLVPVKNGRAIKNALQTLLRDRERTAAMGRKGRERIRKSFTYRQIIEKNQAVYLALRPPGKSL
jgi:glycosyltransferase involved in cell wall biosynthesis